MKHIKTPGGLVHQAIAPEDYVLGGVGSLPFIEYQPNADWRELLPINELQSPNFETMSCTSHGTVNAVEILRKMLGLGSENYSERFLATMSDTSEQGNSPHKVAEVLRKNGLIEEVEYPSVNPETWPEYYSMIPTFIRKIALHWLDTHKFGHEYVPTNPDKMFESLKTSPIGVSVLAWYKAGEFYTKNPGELDNHWALIVHAEYGKYWTVYDSYAPYLKKLPWNYDFGIAKRYSIIEKTADNKNWLQMLFIKLMNLFR